KEDVIKYLASVRGPDSPPIKFKTVPRPAGEAAKVVFTAWDIPFANHADGLAWHDGTDWSEGAATSGSRDMSLHDVVTDDYGNAWLTAFGSMNYTVYKLNTKTGQVSGFSLPTGPNGRPHMSHGLARDQKGIMWFDMFGNLGRIDPATETLSVITPPKNLVLGAEISEDTDKAGRGWSAGRDGLIHYDTQTNEGLASDDLSAP